MITIEVRGLDEYLSWLQKVHLVLSNGLGPLLQGAAGELRDYSESITHVVTGRLAAGHQVMSRGNEAVIFNRVPYAEYEHERGGSHAFYDRTVEERWPRVADDLVKNLLERL